MTNDKAVLLVSFGGPGGMEDVIPFLENIIGGRKGSQARIREVARHYERFGGVSPLNQQMRNLIAALKIDLKSRGRNLPIYFGNRFWKPSLAEALQKMTDEGVKKAFILFSSAYNSAVSTQMYLDELARAQAEIGPSAPQLHPLPVYHNYPGFIEANVDCAQDALEQLPEARRAQARIAFTVHSVPLSMAQESPYQAQALQTASAIAAEMGRQNWQLVYQSRSGPPQQPWLEPDIRDHLQALKAQGAQDVIVAPIGFISDNIEVIYDLDVEAKELAAELGLNMIRAATVGLHPAFVSTLADLIELAINNEQLTNDK